MIPGFQCFFDPAGNFWVADGWVSQLRHGVRIAVGSGGEFSQIRAGIWDGPFRLVPAASGGTCVGGSGRNLILSGLTPGPSGPALPVGIFGPQVPGAFGRGQFTLLVTGASAATISDGTATVAILSTGGTAPVGSYVATTYGKDTYHGGTAFTLAAVAEDGAPGSIPGGEISVSAGSAQTGTYAAAAADSYVSSSDSDWTLAIATDGSAAILEGAAVIATRATGSAYSPEGTYEATAAGEAAHNGGEPWRAFVQLIPVPPGAGFVYLKVTEAAGVLTAVTGPFFAAALPADSTVDFHIPLGQSDGAGGLEQIHTGLLIWPD